MSNRVIVDATALNMLCEEATRHMALRDLVGRVRSSVKAMPKSKAKPKPEPEPEIDSIPTSQPDEPI
jgi:hypothetical protein